MRIFSVVQLLALAFSFSFFVWGDESRSIARVVELTGDAFVVSASGVREKLVADSTISEGSVVETAEDAVVGFSLSDGSAFKLGPAARIILDFPNTKRSAMTLVLDNGKLRASVKKRKKEPSPFFVRTPSATLSGTATSFLVSVSNEDERSRSEFYCMSGTIEIKDHRGRKLESVGAGHSLAVETIVKLGGKPKLLNRPKISSIPPGLERRISSDQVLKLQGKLENNPQLERLSRKSGKKTRSDAAPIPLASSTPASSPLN